MARAAGIPRFAVYLFDIDGTLLDSAADICGAIREVVVKEGASPPAFSHLRGFVGLDLLDCFAEIFPDRERHQLEELFQAYRVEYRAREHRQTSVFPGVSEGLARLRGKKSTATTKGSPMARTLMTHFGLEKHFEHIQGTDGFPSKPRPDVILKALRALGAEPQDCLMVGDSTPDIEAAKAAGVKSCAVRYGYGDPEKLARSKPDYWVGDLRELSSGGLH
jgi:phosphoglycolate phosphatase